MKSKIVFLGLFLMCTFIGKAQRAHTNDWDNAFLIASGTHFEDKITDSKWSNHNGKSFTSAKFKAYSGVTFVKLLAMKAITVSITYEMTISKGEVEMQVVDSRDKVVFKQNFNATESGETHLELKPGEEYQIRFNGKAAKGSYFCQWKEN